MDLSVLMRSGRAGARKAGARSPHVVAAGVAGIAGAISVPVMLGGQTVHPGDVVVADDGVVGARADAGRAMVAAQARVEKEAANRAALARDQLGLDRYCLRDRLGEFGIQYVSFAEYQRETR